ncbi:hypothetical protein FGO68_gene7385 [Halteria grandinella]|uniref:Uncharacterized protein n=1 Tax=Halteria grandinella TaxID=5974 RepID=A0A8J8NB67_HALGN|nr:hypothetical protein FGO68_gene7385 [Halteria grandinella]
MQWPQSSPHCLSSIELEILALIEGLLKVAACVNTSYPFGPAAFDAALVVSILPSALTLLIVCTEIYKFSPSLSSYPATMLK